MNHQTHEDQEAPFSRKKFLTGAATLAASLAATPLFAKDHKGHEHHHHHSKPQHHELMRIANHCASEGQMCVEHCIELVKANDTSIAECMNTAQEMIVLCQGLASLAAYKSELLPEYAKLCMEACKRCEKECKIHAKKHEACKRCAESCAECIEACEKIAA